MQADLPAGTLNPVFFWTHGQAAVCVDETALVSFLQEGIDMQDFTSLAIYLWCRRYYKHFHTVNVKYHTDQSQGNNRNLSVYIHLFSTRDGCGHVTQ
jgi:hypothetical protein